MGFMDFFRRKTQESNSAAVAQTTPVPTPAPVMPQTLAPPEKRTPFPAEAAAKSVDLNMPSLGEGIGIETIELQAELQTIPAAGVNILEVNKELEALKNQLTQKDSEAAKLHKKIKELEAELENTFVKERDKVTSLEEENTLLLEQLHLVQEELETVFLKGQDTAQQLADLKSKLADTSKNLESKDAALKEAVAAKEALAKEKNQLKFTADALQAEKTELTQDRDAKSKLIDELTAQRDQLTNQRNALEKELQQLKRQNEERASAAIADLQQENELLLFQLQQVQEELNYYFVEYQRLEQDAKNQSLRWQRFEKRYPNYIDYDSFVPAVVDALSDTPSIQWAISNILIRGTLHETLTFETYLNGSKPGIRLQGVDICPRGLAEKSTPEALEKFRSISASQYGQLQTISFALETFFATKHKEGEFSEDFDIAFWKMPLLSLARDLRALPPVFRFDKIELKRELINTDYEHLWLVFKGAEYGKYAWPKLEMRLSAANIRPGAFSSMPKLEFPRIDGKVKPFESWFEEAWDDFGGKFELRFDVAQRRFDVGVWSKLSLEDQKLLFSLITRLPDVVAQLTADRVSITRTWNEWLTLAQGCANTLQKLVAAPPKEDASN